MKLLRYGAKGKEKPGLLDKDGKIRGLSGHITDITGDTVWPKSLARLRKVHLKPIFDAIEQDDFKLAASLCVERFEARQPYWLYAARIGTELLLRLGRHAEARTLFEAVIAAVRSGADAVIPGLPVVDTLKRVRGDHVLETVDREELRAVQTPQAFGAAHLRQAHDTAPIVTDDAAAIEAIGGRVVCIPGEAHNRKLTTSEDLEIMRAWCP